jgi:hypothetical protein
MPGLIYRLTTGTSWVVPAGVTGIQVECYGPGASIFASANKITGLNSGGSYSKSNNISVTPGSTVYLNIGSQGGNTWFNTSNVAPTSASSTSSACLAVGSSTASGSQIAANCGDVKYRGGNGYNSPAPSGGWSATGQGGQAGPNGNGADAGPAYYVASNGVYGTGGGANGGSQGGFNTIPFGRGGSGSSQGRGGYVIGLSFGLPSTKANPTQDIVGVNNFLNGGGRYLQTIYDYGPYGGAYGDAADVGPDCETYYRLTNLQTGFIVITLVTQTVKYIVVAGATTQVTNTGSFTLPSDFGSLVSIEAFGSGGINYESPSGGSGGGGYSKTLGSSVTASMVAGSTIVYYQSGRVANATFCEGYVPGTETPSWIRIGTNSAPTSVTHGVLANSGKTPASGTQNIGGLGGTTTGAVGDTKYAGAAGGDRVSSNNFTGGGGGAGGPLGNGAVGGNTFNGSGGGGGGGAANGGNAGSVGTSTAGGAGGTITGGTGGAGATSSTAGTNGTNGGGGGGAFSSRIGGNGGILDIAANTYGVVGGGGGGSGLNTGVAGAGYMYGYTSGIDNFSSGMIVFAYAPTVISTVALTGSSSSASGGTLTPAIEFVKALSGRSATASAGTLTPVKEFTQALSFVSASALTGTLTPSNNQEVGLTSVLALASGGTLTNSQLITQALTGVSVDGRTSSFPAFSEIVGAEGVAGTGVLGYVNTGWQPINTAGGSTNWVDVNTLQE